MKSWLLGIVLTSLAGGLARQLAPQGKEQVMVRLAGGLLLALAILRPLAAQDWAELELPAAPAFQASEQAAVYRKNQQDTLSAIIAEKTEAYIWDKANRLGLTCTVTVTTAAGESGIPLPDAAVLRGPYSGELARCIEEEVGIPAEKLIWLEDEEWQERTENEN
ncbi:MAG: stage III sporulation protein AF [Oscillibacter sp.]|nr:stage III sporulation protein AF [Oscillibacter sp.]